MKSKKKKLDSYQTVQAYIEAIKNEKWNKLFDLCQLTWKKGNTTTPEHFKNMYDMLLPIDKYTILKEDYGAKCWHRYSIIIKKMSGTTITMNTNVICEKAPYTPDINGTWGVNPISTLKREYL